jgi:predicted kinase
MTLPMLVVISGPAGTGKTTLAHLLARGLGCPAVCRDEIKEGMAHAAEHFTPSPGDALTQRTFAVFFHVLQLLLENGVSVVAEATFQDEVWTPKLSPLAPVARLRVVQCHTDPVTARRRIVARSGTRSAHADGELIARLESGDDYFEQFNRLTVAAPSIDVDTTDGYNPTLERILGFLATSDEYAATD